MKKKTIWVVLACALTLQALPTATATDTGGGTAPGGGKVSAGIDLHVNCTGKVSKTRLEAEAEGALLEIGPVKVLPIKARAAAEFLHWSYSCTSKQEVTALGWGGLFQEVTVATFLPGQERTTRAVCSYQGVQNIDLLGQPIARNSCKASFSTATKTIVSKSGTAVAGEKYDSDVEVCAQFGAFGETHTVLTDTGPTSIAIDHCETVAIAYETVQSGSGTGQAALVLDGDLPLIPA